MSKKIFNILSILGLIIIIILSFIIPSNPNQIIKSYTMITIDRPLWLNLIIIFTFFYLIILYHLYDKLFNLKS